MFFSADEEAVVNFELNTEYYLNHEREACYNVFVLKSFDTENEAQIYASGKRVTAQVEYKTGTTFGTKYVRNDPVAYIALSDEENDITLNPQHEREASSESPARHTTVHLEITPTIFNEAHGQNVEHDQSKQLNVGGAAEVNKSTGDKAALILNNDFNESENTSEVSIRFTTLNSLPPCPLNGEFAQSAELDQSEFLNVDSAVEMKSNAALVLNNDLDEFENSSEVSIRNITLDSLNGDFAQKECPSFDIETQSDHINHEFASDIIDSRDEASGSNNENPNQNLHEVSDSLQLMIVERDLNGNVDGLVATSTDKVYSSEHSDSTNKKENLQFDPHFCTLYGFIENNDHRCYFIDDTEVSIKVENIRKLKSMMNTTALDSNFVSILLNAVFGDDVLKESSAGGRQSNFNNLAHKPLDVKKLKFIKDLFDERVSGDEQRKKLFTKYVNKKCNNLRRK